MVINVRGTSGAGKSTLVRSVMERYARKTPAYIEGRKQPIGYLLNDLKCNCADWGMEGTGCLSTCASQKTVAPLWVPGHYETACGGCDTITKVDEAYDSVREHVAKDYDVLFEGIMVQDDVKRAVEFNKTIAPMLVICLTTPLAECLRGIQARRDARGETKPLNPLNTENRAKRVLNSARRLREGGVEVLSLDREAALAEVLKRLRIS